MSAVWLKAASHHRDVNIPLTGQHAMPPNEYALVVPAHPAFLAIYNPSLGTTDEALHNQIVYYYSKSSRSRASRRQASNDDAGDERKQEDENERLRQIGLAQGMVSFAKTFSNGDSVDTVETEKSRVVLHELEPNWWILARIDFTRLASESSISTTPSSKPNVPPSPSVEYSSREVSPSYLLLQQLQRAHSIFLLHHAPTLDSLYNNIPRERFCRILDRFWTRFVLNWDVLLHGNPAVEIFNGIKLAAGAELGIGVGEEEWGSGEREVLEGFISRTDGLVDMVLSRFGDPEPANGKESAVQKRTNSTDRQSNEALWLGRGTYPDSSDGVIFSGMGKIATSSLVSVSQWMEWIYRYGEGAYGVRDDPRSAKRRRRRRNHSSAFSIRDSGPSITLHARSKSVSGDIPNRSLSPGIPPPLVVSPGPVPTKDEPVQHSPEEQRSPPGKPDSPAFGTDTFMKLITLGYGSAWGGYSRSPLTHPRVNILRFGMGGTPDREMSPSDASSAERGRFYQQLDESPGRFLIGLCNDLENEDSDSDDTEGPNEFRRNQAETGNKGTRISSRTLNVSVIEGESNVSKTLRVVIYLYQPFMFVFFFDPDTACLSAPSFYRSVHHQLGPLQKPLLSSTCPSKAAERLSHCSLYHGFKENEASRQHIYDVVSDPSNHTVRASLPNIPEPGASTSGSWTRLDALNVHTQIINTLIETRYRSSETERTCKTSRGWWVLWMRLGDSSSSRPSPYGMGESAIGAGTLGNVQRQAFLIRKASDHVAPGQNSGRGIFRNFSGVSDAQGSWIASGKLAEGIGLDAKRYIEALLSLNR
ncbi:hypothetical protein DIZ76_017759 [Coccidioides immitis]|nr:hypothetical protein DIZ76_017759 [Coccidioides immitis]